MITYHMILNDGKANLEVDQLGTTASDAMQKAIERHVGFAVKSCFSGHKTDPKWGQIHYEIPVHSALTQAPKKRVKVKDATEPMFDDAQIVEESKYAAAKFAR